jgi:hypothetical protein
MYNWAEINDDDDDDDDDADDYTDDDNPAASKRPCHGYGVGSGSIPVEPTWLLW